MPNFYLYFVSCSLIILLLKTCKNSMYKCIHIQTLCLYMYIFCHNSRDEMDSLTFQDTVDNIKESLDVQTMKLMMLL